MRFTVVVDDRERKPLPIPSFLEIHMPSSPHSCNSSDVKRVEIVKQVRQISTADYVLDQDDPANVYVDEGCPHTVIVERKHTVQEMHRNLFGRKRRGLFESELDRMRSTWKRPILLYDSGLTSLFEPQNAVDFPGAVVDAMIRLCYRYEVQFMPVHAVTTAQRVAAGELVTRLLINGRFL